MKTNLKTTKWATGIVVASLLLALFAIPAPAQAGQRTWATVGKILTGVVAANILLDAAAPPPRRTRLARSEIIHHYQPASSVVVHKYVEVQRPAVQVTHHYHTYGTSRSYSQCRPARTGHYRYSVPAQPPIIRYHGRNRRIVQPRVRGHIAHVEVYRKGTWINIGSHSSIW